MEFPHRVAPKKFFGKNFKTCTLKAVKILAFETSCDDTAVAIVENGTNVLASARTGQPEHHEYGGVVPEIAARLHAEHWVPTLESCLGEADLSLSDIDALAVTQGPGLQTSLLTGTTGASFLSLFFQKPLLPVQHIRGHVNSIFLDRKEEATKFPVLVLTVSGGHTEFFLQQSPTDISRLGGTIDDAAGEAFDKCAKLLGLGYPGGPIVSRLAEKGNRTAFDFPRPLLAPDSLDFSFSGLKAAVFRVVEEKGEILKQVQDDNKKEFVADVCASFEAAVADIFVRKVSRALLQFPDVRALHFTGGVSANTHLREQLQELCKKEGITFRVPKKFEYCTDNAAMIAGEAFWQAQEDPELLRVQYVDAQPRMKV
ncbi:MAG: tRNA (adenosine(37)-N6)-threonylcarbamoyltransferase complex transferase subunit TsaD [Candidatus Gracilibacteria bacterium]|nr:tRNA (adenosine(37)-N6)-threonylcarbamoyltransferase complex transferase subunit TsaD [Candidatus Gracilibacteria bacterium]